MRAKVSYFEHSLNQAHGRNCGNIFEHIVAKIRPIPFNRCYDHLQRIFWKQRLGKFEGVHLCSSSCWNEEVSIMGISEQVMTFLMTSNDLLISLHQLGDGRKSYLWTIQKPLRRARAQMSFYKAFLLETDLILLTNLKSWVKSWAYSQL